MNQVDLMNRTLEMTYKAMEAKQPKPPQHDICDQCEREFLCAELQSYENDGSDVLLCEECAENPSQDDPRFEPEWKGDR